MPRYGQYGNHDDVPVLDGDTQFLGFSSRLQPTSLPPGVASYLGNMRCDRGTARPRKGLKALSTDISLINPPIVLDFSLAVDFAIASITRIGTTATVTTSLSHGYATGNTINIRGAVQTDYNGDKVITVSSATVFTFTVVNTAVTPATGTMLANKGPILLNTYSDEVRGSCVYSNSSNVEGIVIASTDRAYVYRYGQASVTINYPVGETVASTDSCDLIQFLNKVYLFRGRSKFAMSWDLNTANPFVVVPSAALGGTLIPMPKVDWGIHFKSRFFLPYQRDELILSDIGDAGTYDTIYSQLKIMRGTNDWLVGVHPYQEARVLVLYRKSVHALILDGTSLAISQVFEITRDVGCVARRSIATCGNNVVWLSDNGVYVLDISAELNLRGSQAPLSDPIQDQIDSINWAYAGNSVGIYFNNRYYLAVPVGTSTTNNRVFVYNFLNAKWESVDSYPGSFDVKSFALMDYNGKKRLHAVTTFGFVFLLEEKDVDDWGTTATIITYPISGSLYTRNYLSSTYDMKRIKRAQIESNLTSGDAFTANFVASNPDRTLAILSYTATATGDVSHKKNIGARGVSGRLEITTTSGRPEFKSITTESAESDRQTLSRS